LLQIKAVACKTTHRCIRPSFEKQDSDDERSKQNFLPPGVDRRAAGTRA
jgi:hypothetical protein